ncbi:MAG: hypothetical protein QM528_05880 [Phycisphaerales bacterium]|nr:hypothetical protein [Phycisphaerales bacterium]
MKSNNLLKRTIYSLRNQLLISCTFIFLLTHHDAVVAQYYYNDIIANKQTNVQFALFKKNNIHSIITQSLLPDGTPSPRFSINETINYLTNTAQIESVINGINNRNYSQYDDSNRIIKSNSYTNDLSNVVYFFYNKLGLLKEIETTTVDSIWKAKIKENHYWFYNSNNQLMKMVKVKDNKDTMSVITFKLDSAGYPLEETWIEKKEVVAIYYYYYNSERLLSDVVRLNLKSKKLIPEVIFEYTTAGLIRQLTKPEVGVPNKFTRFDYEYNAQELNTTQKIYNKLNKLIGVVVYNYK